MPRKKIDVTDLREFLDHDERHLRFAITHVDGFDPQNAHGSRALHSEGNTWNEASRIPILMCRKILGG